MYRVEVYDQTSQPGNDPTGRLAVLDNAYQKSQVKELSNAGSYSFSLPWDDPKSQYLKELNHVKVFKEGQDLPVFDGRIMTWEKWMDEEGKFLCRVTCEGFATVLREKIWPGQVEHNNISPASFYAAVLAKQDKVTLGTIEPATVLSTKFSYDNLMYMLWKVPSIIGGDIEVDPATRQLHHWNEKGRDLGGRIAYGLNMRSLNVKTDPTNLVTRLYGLGEAEGVNQVTIKPVNGGVEYLDANTQSIYGIIESTYVDKEIHDPGTLKLKMIQLMDANKVPYTTWECSAVDLSSLPGYDHLGFDLGDWIIGQNELLEVDIKLRIVRMTEDHDNPENVDLEWGSKVRDLADELSKIKSKQGAWDRYPQGAPNLFCVNKEENVDPTHPLRLRFPIPSQALKITRVLLSLRGLALQYFSQVSGTGGGSTQTSTEDGDHAHMWASFTGGSSSFPLRNYMTDADAYVGGGVRNIAIQAEEIGDLYTDNVSTKHAHRVTIPPHSHPQSLDIFDGPPPKNITLKIDGTDHTDILPARGDGVAGFAFEELDIGPYLSPGITTHTIEIGTEQLGRIDAWVIPQVYIQSN